MPELVFLIVIAAIGLTLYGVVMRAIRRRQVNRDTGDIFEEKREQEERLIGRLRTLPVVEISGVTDANGPAGTKSGGAEHWRFQMGLDAWRVNAGEMSLTPLKIWRPTSSDEEFESLRGTIAADSLIRLRARLSHDEKRGPIALLEELIDAPVVDTELEEARKKLMTPVTVESADLGTFELDRRIKNFCGKIKWQATIATMTLETGDTEELESILRHVRTLLADEQSWHERILDAAVKELLDLKNESWLGEGESPITARQFRAAMKLETLTIDADGNFSFWFEDGDLFWGHAITVDGSLSDGPTDAGIAG